MIANGTYTFASNTWAISNFINPWIKYLLIISCKQVSPLIVLSINTPKPTRGPDALSISPFFVIDDKPIKTYKKIFNKAFEFSDLIWAPLNLCKWMQFNTFSLTCQFAQIKKNGIPPKSQHPWVQKCMCAYTKFYTWCIWQDKTPQFKKESWLCLMPTGHTGLTDRSDRSTPDSQPKTTTHQSIATHYHKFS